MKLGGKGLHVGDYDLEIPPRHGYKQLGSHMNQHFMGIEGFLLKVRPRGIGLT